MTDLAKRTSLDGFGRRCAFAARRVALCCLLALAYPFIWNCPAQDANTAGLKMHSNRGMRVHDPSTIVKCKAEYWFFATGPGIVSWHSSDLVNWTNGPRVFDTPPAWTTNTI